MPDTEFDKKMQELSDRLNWKIKEAAYNNKEEGECRGHSHHFNTVDDQILHLIEKLKEYKFLDFYDMEKENNTLS